MAIPRPVLMVELLMSADRVITAAEAAAIPADPDVDWWSPAVVVGHLSQVDLEVWLPRLELMVEARAGSSRPSFAWWEPDADATRRAFGVSAPTTPLLACSRVARAFCSGCATCRTTTGVPGPITTRSVPSMWKA